MSHFTNAPFTIDDYIGPTDTTCPPNPLLAFAARGGTAGSNGPPGSRRAAAPATSSTASTTSSTSSTVASRTATSTGSDAMGLTRASTTRRPCRSTSTCTSKDHPDYAIEDNFFQAAFGGSFLNHQWLIAAASPVDPTGAPGGANATRHPVLDTNGMPSNEPLYTSTHARRRSRRTGS